MQWIPMRRAKPKPGRIYAVSVVFLATALFAGCGGSDAGSKFSAKVGVDGLEATRPDLVPAACREIANGRGSMVQYGISASYGSEKPGYPTAQQIYEEVASRC